MLKSTFAAAMIVAAVSVGPASAQSHAPAHHSASAAMADGEVRKVDKDAGKLTLKHGPIASLDMPEMTMVFRVKDKAMLDSLKQGDRIKFTADKINGAYTVTTVEVVK